MGRCSFLMAAETGSSASPVGPRRGPAAFLGAGGEPGPSGLTLTGGLGWEPARSEASTRKAENSPARPPAPSPLLPSPGCARDPGPRSGDAARSPEGGACEEELG